MQTRTSRKKLISVWRKFAIESRNYFIDRQWGYEKNIRMMKIILSGLMPGPAIPIRLVTSFVSDGIEFHDGSVLWFSPSFHLAYWQYP